MSSGSRERAKQRDRAKKAEEKKIEEGVKVDDADHVTIRRQTELLVDDYNSAYRKLERIQGELKAHQALLKHLSVTDRNGDSPLNILEEVAETLIVAARGAHPLQAAALDPMKVRHSKLPPDPGASTRAARRAERRFHKHLRDAIDDYDASQQRSFLPDPNKPPKVRCRNRDCPAEDNWVDAWRDIRGGRRIYVESCSSCKGPLSKDNTSQPHQ